jgi:hypothetical protein
MRQRGSLTLGTLCLPKIPEGCSKPTWPPMRHGTTGIVEPLQITSGEHHSTGDVIQAIQATPMCPSSRRGLELRLAHMRARVIERVAPVARRFTLYPGS